MMNTDKSPNPDTDKSGSGAGGGPEAANTTGSAIKDTTLTQEKHAGEPAQKPGPAEGGLAQATQLDKGASAESDKQAGKKEGAESLSRSIPPKDIQGADGSSGSGKQEPGKTGEADSIAQAAERKVEKTNLDNLITEHYNLSRKWAFFWGISHYFTLLLSFALGLVTILVLKLGNYNDKDRIDIAVLLIGLAAVSALLNWGVRFDALWRRDQTTQSRLDKLRVDITNAAVSVDALRERLKKIINEHHDSVLSR